MALSLGQKRELFARLLPLLLTHIKTLGFEARLDELKRGQQQADYNAATCARCKKGETFHAHANHSFRPIGSKNSLHCDGLAIDLYLRRPPSKRILWSTESYRELGCFWESLHDLTYWGGRTDKPGDRLQHDGGHFSITHQGRQ